ncbi:site-specific integrase [Ferrimonas kyonanensis]|uniref:tyrosine-type recombinase/integrase n=1 Tax=Ferrimonas kyonanensis TaxID=364763 RepID=UPI001B7F8C0B
MTAATSTTPERDIMLLWLTHTTGIRVTELSLLKISDVMFPSGDLRSEVFLRPVITKHCRPRTIYLTHVRAIEAVEEWLDYRQRRGWECGQGATYRGFWGGSTLVLTHKGRAFEQSFKTRKLKTGSKTYRVCDSLQQSISRTYRRAGIWGGSSHSGRRTLANRVVASTGSIELAQQILGHSELEHVAPYLDIDPQIIRLAFTLAL